MRTSNGEKNQPMFACTSTIGKSCFAIPSDKNPINFYVNGNLVPVYAHPTSVSVKPARFDGDAGKPNILS